MSLPFPDGYDVQRGQSFKGCRIHNDHHNHLQHSSVSRKIQHGERLQTKYIRPSLCSNLQNMDVLHILCNRPATNTTGNTT